MALPKEPVVKKFFTNKIESTRDDWYGYLVQIARIFYTLDGEEYNRDVLMNKFAAMSGRDATQAQPLFPVQGRGLTEPDINNLLPWRQFA